MTGHSPCKFYSEPKLPQCSLLVSWMEDAGRLGPTVIGHLNKKLGGRLFCEIEPEGFFQLGGVLVEDNIAQFPESKFYYCPDQQLVIFQGNSPRTEWYKFLNTILDVVEKVGRIAEIYTIGGMVTLAAHTTPRMLLTTANSPEMKSVLGHYDLARDLDYETPPGQRPTISSYLLWVARRRNIRGAAIWVPVPFYLLATGDPRAHRKTVDFLNRRFNLNLDLSEIDEAIHQQNVRIASLANQFPEMDDFLHKLESNITLTDDENSRLVQLMEENLSKEC